MLLETCRDTSVLNDYWVIVMDIINNTMYNASFL